MVRDALTFPARRTKASVTLVSLCLTTAVGIALTSYLALCSRSAAYSARMLHQEKAQELAHLGLEEALWSLNNNTWTGAGSSGSTAWTTTGANKSVTLTYPLASQGSGQVVITVANYASTGPTWPTITAAATVTATGGVTYTKNLQSTLGPTPLFGNAIASSDSYVSFVAGGTVDSWNSDPDDNSATAAIPYSFTAGNPTNYAAVIAAKGNGTYGVALTQATVRGYVATFGQPVSYSTSGSPAGKVLGPTTPTGVNVDSSRLGKSAFVPASVFTVSLPPAATPPDSGGGGLLGFLLKLVLDLVSALLSGSGDSYKTSDDLNITDSDSSLTINRPMKLVVNGDLNISGSGKITIETTGSLELYVTGDVTIGGNGIRNQTGVPKKMALFCTSASTTDSLTYTTSENYCGVIFSENKPIDIRQNATFYGALLSRQYVRFSASATAPVFHYDSALRNVRFNQVSTPYIVKKVTDL